MGRTRIELLSSGDIDMYDDVSTPLTFAIADIRDPSKRNSHFSKTIKVPATKGNNIRFGHIFDINLKDGTYNPNRKAPCTLYIDDVPQINGFLQILSIEVDDKNDIQYNVSIKGNVNNIFQTLGDDELTDLDLSAFDHTLTRVNQKASWTNTYTQGYCYPLIDYGFDNNINHYKVEHLMPAVFVRTLIDKIFSNAGFTYRSTFFDSTIFKNLIIPCTGEGFRYSNSQALAKNFEANRSSLQNIPYLNFSNNISTWSQISFNNDVNDPSNAFDTGTGKWTVPSSGYYSVICDVAMNTSGSIQYGGSPATTQVFPRIGIRKVDITTSAVSLVASLYTSVLSGTPVVQSVTASNIYLKAGDVLDCCINDGYQGFTGSLNIQVATTGSRFYNTVSNTGLQAGDTVNLTNTLPTKIKQKDLLLDLIRMFNLYVEVDKNDSNKLNIETRDDFYTSGTIVDWTYKLDNSKPLELTPMGDLDFKMFKYSYKDDKDFYNKKYLDDYKIGYGNREYEIVNEFLTNTNETKVMFAPTPLVAPNGDDRIISKIWEVDSSNVVKNKPFGIRLLYNGGVKTTALPYQYEDTTVSTTTETQYLYAGHLDSVTAPTLDLSFGVPNELYYTATIYTSANLFNLYHKKFIDEITDPDSKVVTGYFHLTPYDIEKIDFRDSFYFEGQDFRLNKIYDYNPIDASVTKCEFIKIKEGRSFTGSTAVVSGGVATVFDGLTDRKPVISDAVNTGTPRSTIVYGNNNVIGNGLRNSYINGSDNYIHGGNNINLLGSSGNTIYDGLENVTLINTSGTTVYESNTLYVNGYSITSGTIASLSSEWATPAYSSGNFYPDAGTWTVDAGDVITSRYIVIGKTLFWNVYLANTTTATTPNQLYLTLPNNYNANAVTFHNGAVSVGASIYNDIIVNANATTYITVYRSSGSNFANGACNISFNIVIEIQ